VSNPWVQWWQEFQSRMSVLTISVVQSQLLAFGLALLVAAFLDRYLERYKARWLGGPPEQRRLRSVLWAAQFPILALICGYVALSIYTIADHPSYTLGKLVTLFWFITAYALVAKSVVILMPEGEGRRIIRRVLLPLLATLGVMHLLGLLEVLWVWASQFVVNLGTETLTGSTVGLALLIVIVFWLVAKGGRALFIQALVPSTRTDPNLARSVGSFLQFAVVVVGVWVAVLVLGLDASNLTLVISALTVGIGFGLQDVIKNLMGGLILLGEGHVLPNHVYEISDETGIVELIGLRSTVIRTWDGSRVIVPNAELIANKVRDLSRQLRLDLQVGISTTADIQLAEQLLLEAAAAHPNIVAEPAPSVVFAGFGESTYDLGLYAWVADRSVLLSTKTELYHSVIEILGEHGVEMPYRQLDVHLHAAAGQLPPGGGQAAGGTG
jgi:small-conductance mechanosensitive channel